MLASELNWVGEERPAAMFNGNTMEFYSYDHPSSPLHTLTRTHTQTDIRAKMSNINDRSPSTMERELFFRVIFPYATKAVILKAAASTESIEDSIHNIHASVNPDVYSASFLMEERKEQERLQDLSFSDMGSMAFKNVCHMLTERSLLVQEHILPSSSLNHEYIDTVASFPMDTSAWDDHYINYASVTDVAGASTFLLPSNAEATQALIPQWPTVPMALAPMRKTERDEWFTRLSTDILPFFRETVGEAEWEEFNLKEEIAEGISGLMTPLEFGIRKQRQWRAMIKELEPWAAFFNGRKGCALVKEISENCPKLADALPDLVPKLLEVFRKELINQQVTAVMRDEHIDALGGYTVSCDSIKIHELVFGRSYLRFVENGTALDIRLKVKRLASEPVMFSYRRTRSRCRVSSGNMEINVKDVIVKVKGNMIMEGSGRGTIHCMKSHVSIGAIRICFSETKLNIAAFLLGPIIRSKVRKAMMRFLSEEIVLA